MRIDKVEKIIIHHSLTKDGRVVDWDAIRRYHIQTRHFTDIGYHFGLERVNGKLTWQIGRDPRTMGAHTKEYRMNHKSLGVCVVGNFDNHEPDNETYHFLAKRVAKLCREYDLNSLDIDPHHKYTPYKSCPGKMFDMAYLRRLVTIELESGAFRDIEGHWCEKTVVEAARLNILKGNQGLFRPDDTLTRAEFAAGLLSLYKILKEE